MVNASVDEICMKFIDGSGSSVIINANIQVYSPFLSCIDPLSILSIFKENYPRQPPIWFSESDDVPAIGAALQNLTESATDQPITILHQVRKDMEKKLNRYFSYPLYPLKHDELYERCVIMMNL